MTTRPNALDQTAATELSAVSQATATSIAPQGIVTELLATTDMDSTREDGVNAATANSSLLQDVSPSVSENNGVHEAARDYVQGLCCNLNSIQKL